MVPDPNRTEAGDPEGSPLTRKTDGGSSTGFDEAALYAVIRAAVKDALLDVLGTVLLVGVAFVLVVGGAQALVGSASTTGMVLGAVAVAVGLYLAAATLEVIPPIRDWF
jgi:hypothetical protein